MESNCKRGQGSSWTVAPRGGGGGGEKTLNKYFKAFFIKFSLHFHLNSIKYKVKISTSVNTNPEGDSSPKSTCVFGFLKQQVTSAPQFQDQSIIKIEMKKTFFTFIVQNSPMST
jgi:hypothetical protein